MKVKVALIGAGGRGQFCYAPYARNNPNEVEFVAVAEPRDFLREQFISTYGVKPEFAFESWEDMLKQAPVADCVIIATQDNMHVEPAIAAIEKGYKYILLEKPIDPEFAQSKRLADIANANNVNIQVCHSLRYAPYVRKLKEVIDSGAIGEIVNIQHIEGVGFYHQAHSFVRGDWGNTAASSPMILAKCCHDMDMMVYLTGKKCVSLSSYGSLKHFTPEYAPQGSAERCTDGCKAKDTCPYNAVRIYSERDEFRKLACEKEGFSDLTEALQIGRYGRCVYRCNNDVVDHQVVNMLLEDNLTVSFTMSAFSYRTERVTRVMGTMGEIKADMEDSLIEVYEFAGGNTQTIKVKHSSAGHSGADEVIMRDFVEMVQAGNKGYTDINISLQSHAMCEAAEISRAENRVVELKELLGNH